MYPRVTSPVYLVDSTAHPPAVYEEHLPFKHLPSMESSYVVLASGDDGRDRD